MATAQLLRGPAEFEYTVEAGANGSGGGVDYENTSRSGHVCGESLPINEVGRSLNKARDTDTAMHEELGNSVNDTLQANFGQPLIREQVVGSDVLRDCLPGSLSLAIVELEMNSSVDSTAANFVDAG